MIQRAVGPVTDSPKEILGISGYPREGAQVGELAGAISIQIPVDHR